MRDPSPTRRRLLAAAALPSTTALAGCFEEVDEPAPDGADSPDEEEVDGSDDENGEENDGATDDDGGGEDDAEEADDDGDGETETPTPTPESVDPADSGLRVVETEYTVTDEGWETQVEAEVTVENAGEYTYGYVELRVDAYYSPPGRATEEALEFTYAGPENFGGFSSGTRTFEEIEIAFSSSDADDSTDDDRFRVDAAVRRAVPR